MGGASRRLFLQPLHGSSGEESGPCFADALSPLVNRIQQAFRKSDIHANGLFAQLRQVDINEGPDPPPIPALALEILDPAGSRGAMPLFQMIFQPQERGFFGVDQCFIERVTGRIAAGHIREYHTVGVTFVAGFNCDGIAYDSLR